MHFVYFIVRISDQGGLGVYSQSNLTDRIQYSPQNGIWEILVVPGVINYDA